MRAGLLSRTLAVFAILLATSQAHALQTFPQFMALVEGRVSTVGVGTTGTLLVAKVPALGAGSGWVKAGNFGAATVPTGVNVASDMTVAVAGLNVATTAAGVVSKADIATAAAGCLMGGVAGCVIGAASVGIPLLTAWMNASSVRINPTTSVVEDKGANYCAANCYTWSGNGLPNNPTFLNPADACRQVVPTIYGGTYTDVAPVDQYGNAYCFGLDKSGVRKQYGSSSMLASRPPDSGTWYPSTSQSVRDALYNNVPSPAIVDELAKYGNINWAVPTVSLTGPATVTSPTTTTTNPDGTKKIVSSTTPITYSGPKATAGPTTTTTTTQSSTGAVTGTTTETTTPGTEAAKVDEGSPSDTALPALPKLYTRQYPDGLVGVWNTKSAAVKATPLMTLVGNLMPDNLGSSGACPRWVLPMDIATWASFGSADVSPPCYLWDFGKAVIIVSSLLLARRLIFGG